MRMKLLWLCNTQPGVIREAIGKKGAGAVNWVDSVLRDLRLQGVQIRVLCPGNGSAGDLDENCSYATFRKGKPHELLPEMEAFFDEQIKSFCPDVIHIWGTEYAHTLALVNAAEKAELLDHTVASIQGLCRVYAGHYTEGLPKSVQYSFTLRDVLRQDNIRQQQKKFVLRGELETQALKKLRHVIGRTDWDHACTMEVNPNLTYHFCNETLREPFYQGQWRYENCHKHRIFASSKAYPVKGFHYLLQILPQLREKYPDVTLAVTGGTYLGKNPISALRREGYEKYLRKLTKQYGVEDCVEFLGSLSADAMKAAYLEANVFALPSTIENSPNSLGEAMLLGTPCVAADVGGVANLMRHGTEGYVYQPTATYMLRYYIEKVFEMEDSAQQLGACAKAHAQQTHDPETNLQTLLEIYQQLA